MISGVEAVKKRGRYLGVLLAALLGACVIGADMAGALAPPQGTQPKRDLTQAAAVAKDPIDSANALRALEANLEALGVKRLRSQSGASGLGQAIAVIDTGVDPRVFGGPSSAAPDRVTDWIDLTGEGLAEPIGEYVAEHGIIHAGEIPINVANLQSRSGKYYVGVLPSALTSALGSNRQVYFVVSDPDSAGLYNTVTVDADSDLSLANDVSLREFRNNRSYALLRLSQERSLAFVVSRVDSRTGKVCFGFDLNGHGTAIAALAAGSGVVPGTAPEARVIVVKALASDGLGDWVHVEKGIEEAMASKANVVLVGSVRQQFGTDREWLRLQSKLASIQSHLVLPAGNAGPGAGTLTVSSESDSTVLVSGYLPQASANALLGGRFSGDVWYPMSSCGPGPDGNRGPSFSAPAIAPVPRFKGDGELSFSLMEGTSVSAGYAGGAIALLRQTQTDSEGALSRTLSFFTAGLLQGAAKLPGVLPVEQGNGRLNVLSAWEILRSRSDHRRLLLSGDWDRSAGSDGIWVKGTTPGGFPAWIDNFAPVAREVYLSASVPWLRTRSEKVLMEPVSQRETIVYGSGELAPGFYSGEIAADDPATKGVDASFAVTVSIPHQFDALGKSSFKAEYGAGGVTRQFIRVPQYAESMSLTISGASPGERYAIYSPGGIPVRQGSIEGSVVTRIGLPQAGLWQVCLFGANVSSSSTPAKVEASLDGFFATDLGSSLRSQYYILRSQGAGAEVRPLAADHASEWRHRSSFAQQTGRSTQLMLPDITKPMDALSVKFGTVTGSALRAYLMYFDPAVTRWSEVGRAISTLSGVGEIHLPKPAAGKYAVYVEAYGSGNQVYVELDVNLLAAGTKDALSGVAPSSMPEGSNTLELPLRSDPETPSLIVVLRQSDSKVMGILERPLIRAGDIPVIQISGGPEISTIRAWAREGMRPLDALVTVGGMSYQLSGGHMTAPVPAGLHPSLKTKEGSRILLLPPHGGL